MQNLEKIFVVGGGTAGWLTALYAQKIFPKSRIHLIESEEIGIVGAGEGTTANIITFLQDLGIDHFELIKETGATLKLNIKFDNWNGDGKYYYHAFSTFLGLDNPSLQKMGWPAERTASTYFNDDARLYLIYAIANNIPLDDVILNNLLAEKNKSNFSISGSGVAKPITMNSYHFDASRLAQYLRKIAEQRGVIRIEGIVETVINNSDGYLTKLRLKDEKTYLVDFVFDCTGFKRQIIGKFYQTKWKSYQKHLKVKSVIPFFLQPEKDRLVNYTNCIAMKYGWMFRIPLQHRYGSGYIFDSDYINADQAKKEVEEYLGFEIDPIRQLNFDAGRYEKGWVKNCISIGLSYGFTEPIEATAIMMLIIQLSLIPSHISGVVHRSETVINKYNDFIAGMNDRVMEFLVFHYITKRKDSEFWRSLQDRSFVPDSLKEKLEIWKYQPPSSIDDHTSVPWEPFAPDNYLMVGHGLGIFEGNKWGEYLKTLNINNLDYLSEIKSTISRYNNMAVDHLDLIHILKNK